MVSFLYNNYNESMKDTKNTQVNIRISSKEKDDLQKMAENNGYNNLSRFLIDSTLNRVESSLRKIGNVFVISLSAGIDYFISIENLGKNKKATDKFFSKDKIFSPGGRGLNLSKMLNMFMVENVNVNFHGGDIGDLFHNMIKDSGIKQHTIKTDARTKVNVYAEDKNGNNIDLEQKTEPLSELALEKLKTFISLNVSNNDIFILSGSFHEDDVLFLNNILKELQKKGTKLYINTSSTSIGKLVDGIQPEFIILNSRNFNGEIKTRSQIDRKMIDLLRNGAKEVAWIVDESFCFFYNKEKKYSVSSNLIEHLTFTGIEDSFIAGYIANQSKDIVESLKWGGAAMKAKADNKGKFSFEDILQYHSSITVEEI